MRGNAENSIKICQLSQKFLQKKLAAKVALHVGSMRTQNVSIGRRTTNHT
jgi:hypothetical protein